MSLFATQGLKVSLDPRRKLSFELTLEVGDVLHLLGPSGCGKTTLLRTLARLRAPDAGNLLLEDVSASDIPPPTWRRGIAYLPQRPVMLPGTVESNLAAGLTYRRAQGAFDLQLAKECLRGVGLDKDLLSRDAALLSGGEAARIALCRALMLNPKVLLCDELTAGLDEENSANTINLLAEHMANGAIIFVAHDPSGWRSHPELGAKLREQALEPIPLETP
ncbi:MAG: ATP-binding cassette domain-containing protein [Deltaproteobacteria bacterium]|nr:ATP-binding cassette domain-containing protein [Deltaproteobacteria bacterium]